MTHISRRGFYYDHDYYFIIALDIIALAFSKMQADINENH